jgi:hypothetical protein
MNKRKKLSLYGSSLLNYLGVPLRFATGRHLTGFASLMASPPLRGPPGGSRKPSRPEALGQTYVPAPCTSAKKPLCALRAPLCALCVNLPLRPLREHPLRPLCVNSLCALCVNTLCALCENSLCALCENSLCALCVNSLCALCENTLCDLCVNSLCVNTLHLIKLSTTYTL